VDRLGFFLLFLLPCFCQSLSIGVKGGVRATGDFNGSGASESKRYAVGPALEAKLPLRFALEVDVLYSSFGLRSTDGFFGTVFHQSWRANSWEFPIVGKFRPAGPIYVEGGYVPRTLHGSARFDSTTVDFAGNGTRQVIDQKTDYQVSHGVLAGGGIDWPMGRLRLSPEVRYTRWLTDAFDREGSRGFFLRPSQNRAEFLVTMWWK